MPKTTVIHVGHLAMMPPNVVYIGRSNAKYLLSRSQSKFHNPFREGEDGTREQVIARFEEWFRKQPELMAAAKKELKGKALACWCRPEKACHGDVLARIAEEPETA